MIHLPADLISLELSREDLIAIPASSPDSVPVTSASLGPQHTTAITVNLQEPTVIYLAVYFLLGETVKKTGEKVPLLEFFMLVLYLSKHVWASLVAQTVGNPPAVCVYQRASQTVPVVKNPPANAGRSNRHEFDGCIRKIPWRRAQPPTPLSLPEVILWTEEPGRLHFIALHRVRHNWSDWAWMHVGVSDHMRRKGRGLKVLLPLNFTDRNTPTGTFFPPK